jgi:excisionase family DNA binding protein
MALLTPEQAANTLGVDPSTLRRWESAGLLSSVRTPGGHRRFDADLVTAFRARHVGHPRGAAQPDAPVEQLLGQLLSATAVPLTVALLHSQLHQLGQWNLVCTALEAALVRMRVRVGEGVLSRVDARLMTERLMRALCAICDGVPRTPAMPRAWLVNAEGEDVTLPLHLLEPVVLAAGHSPSMLGRRMALMNVTKELRTQDIRALVVHASAAMRNPGALATQVQLLSRACRAQGATLVLFGNAAWPPEAQHHVCAHAVQVTARLLQGE